MCFTTSSIILGHAHFWKFPVVIDAIKKNIVIVKYFIELSNLLEILWISEVEKMRRGFSHNIGILYS